MNLFYSLQDFNVCANHLLVFPSNLHVSLKHTIGLPFVSKGHVIFRIPPPLPHQLSLLPLPHTQHVIRFNLPYGMVA